MNIKSGVYWLHNNNFSLHNIFNVDILMLICWRSIKIKLIYLKIDEKLGNDKLSDSPTK